MLSVNIFVCIPLSREKRMLFADNFSIKEGGQGGILISQTHYLQITTEIRVFDIHMLERNEQLKHTLTGGIS